MNTGFSRINLKASIRMKVTSEVSFALMKIHHVLDNKVDLDVRWQLDLPLAVYPKLMMYQPAFDVENTINSKILKYFSE